MDMESETPEGRLTRRQEALQQMLLLAENLNTENKTANQAQPIDWEREVIGWNIRNLKRIVEWIREDLKPESLRWYVENETVDRMMLNIRGQVNPMFLIGEILDYAPPDSRNQDLHWLFPKENSWGDMLGFALGKIGAEIFEPSLPGLLAHVKEETIIWIVERLTDVQAKVLEAALKHASERQYLL